MIPSSFLHRCQGAIAGAWQAANLGHWCLSHSPAHLWLAQWTLTPWQGQPLSPIVWRMADRCAQDLIHNGQVAPEHWLAGDQAEGDFSAETFGAHRALTPPTDAEILLALLPVALFYHDTPTHLVRAAETLCERVFLTLNAEVPQESAILLRRGDANAPDWSSIRTAWEVFALALAHSCRGTLEPMTLIPESIAHADTEMVRCLHGVQQGLTQGAGLSTVLPWLLEQGGTGVERQVALALYCFLSAPRDFRGAVVRSLQATQHQPSLFPDAPGIAALTGALAGCYQGGHGLPLAISPALDHLRSRSVAAGESHFDAGPAVLQKMVPLVAAWAGAYQPQGRSSLPSVIAPPLV